MDDRNDRNDSGRENIVRLFQAAQSAIQEFRETWRRLWPALQVVAEGIRRLPEKTRLALLELGSHGWYMDPYLPAGALFTLSDEFSKGSKEDANRGLCNWVDGQLTEAEARLVAKFPNREQVIREAFTAHREELYAVAIPVFLAQADGICQELHNVELYKGSRLKSKAKRSGLADIEQTFLAPLVEPSPLVANKKERKVLSNNLNRHAILHGESVDYGTRENSCRAISLLTYTAWVLSDVMPNNAMEPDA